MNNDEKELLCKRMSEKLIVLRSMLRLSQSDLANRIGISRQTIVSLERCKRTMSWSTFLSLVLVFSSTPSTCELLKLFEIYTPDLEAYLSNGESVSIEEEEDEIQQ